jgi:hypothetical protein
MNVPLRAGSLLLALPLALTTIAPARSAGPDPDAMNCQARTVTKVEPGFIWEMGKHAVMVVQVSDVSAFFESSDTVLGTGDKVVACTSTNPTSTIHMLPTYDGTIERLGNASRTEKFFVVFKKDLQRKG